MTALTDKDWYGPESVAGACISMAFVVSATTYLLALTAFFALPLVGVAIGGLFVTGSIRRFATGLLTGLTAAVPVAVALLMAS